MASAPWTPAQEGVHQICYLLAEYQKIGTNQGQVNFHIHDTRSFVSGRGIGGAMLPGWLGCK
jgi:hypothetical protein